MTVTSPAVHVLQTALNALLLLEEYERAWALVERTVAEAREAGALAVLPNLLLVRAHLEFLTGDWAAAYASASAGVRLGDVTHQPIAGAYALTGVARIEAAQGRERECREHAAQALARAESYSADSIRVLALTALGLLVLGLGGPTEAITRLESVERLAAARGFREASGPIQWRPDLVEAYVRAGREQDARRVLERFEREEHGGQTSVLAAAARCRGLLADDDAFEPEFERARGWHDRTSTPFARARTDLCFGERLRRAKRREHARAPLRAALEVFERLGARPWAERARAELRASGQTARRRDPAAAGRLTAQELQVALRIAAGATNREAAAELFLSPKTIEYHLANVYRKLDVHTRARLARLVAQREHEAFAPVPASHETQ